MELETEIDFDSPAGRERFARLLSELCNRFNVNISISVDDFIAVRKRGRGDTMPLRFAITKNYELVEL